MREIRKILIAGAGKMGSWLADTWSEEYEVAVYDQNPQHLKYLYRVERFDSLEDVEGFQADLLVNAVSLHQARSVFEELEDRLPPDCLFSDIASVKNGLSDYYASGKRPFVSVHPMFGPTFANIRELKNHHAILIRESDVAGLAFYTSFFHRLGIQTYEYGFEEHDEMIAYSLSVPFASSMVFAACLDKQQVPGTTFHKHLQIARGLLNEDKYLLSEILQSPHSLAQITRVGEQIQQLITFIKEQDTPGIHSFIDALKQNMLIQTS